MDTQEAREQLEQVLRELDATTATLESEEADDGTEMSNVDQHSADAGSDITDLDRQNAVLEAAGAQRAEVEAALVRLDAGTWGTCIDCNAAIPSARLEVRPEAARCVECQSAYEKLSA